MADNSPGITRLERDGRRGFVETNSPTHKRWLGLGWKNPGAASSPTSKPLESMTRAQLTAEAKRRGIRVANNMQVPALKQVLVKARQKDA